jgi:hypothetical protein
MYKVHGVGPGFPFVGFRPVLKKTGVGPGWFPPRLNDMLDTVESLALLKPHR